MIPGMKRLLPVLTLLALPVLAEEGTPDPKAVAAADKLFEFLRAAEVPKEEAQKTADHYEGFREKPPAEREKALREILAKPAFRGRAAIADMLKALGRMDLGPGVRENTADKLRRQRLENEELQEKKPKDYEALLDDASRRAGAIKHCGVTREDDIRAIEPYVFPGLGVREALKALGAALKSKGIDAQDAAWVADAADLVWRRYYKGKAPSEAGESAGGGEVPPGDPAPPPPPRRPPGRRR